MKKGRSRRASRAQQSGTLLSIGLLLVSQLVGCDPGGPGEPNGLENPPQPAPAGFAVSGPTGTVELAGPAAGPVYISASPGTFPDGVSVKVTNVSTGESVSARINDGGIDPILISAAPNDELEVFVLNRDGTSAVYRALTPWRRRPRVVRTRPPRDATEVVLNTAVVVVFSEPVDESTITTETVRLWLDGGPVDGFLVLRPDG
ncbi:MAG: Ig-like domain-containing protein, partial [Gemmatimonadota bacterium]